MTPSQPDQKRPRGIALVSVLLGLAVLSLIAAAMLVSSRVAVRTARLETDRAQANAMIDAAVARAVLALTDRRADHRWRVDGVWQRTPLFGETIEIAIEDEQGKIDLNDTSDDQLRRLFISQGLDAQAAQALADKVLDWRDPTDLKRLHGAKAAEYRDAGLAYGPRNGRFQRVSELELVMGMTPELYQRVKPALTVYSNHAAFNVMTAPREVLLTIPGWDAQKVNGFLATRAAPETTPNGPVVQGKIDLPIPLGGWPFTIHVRVPLGHGGVMERAVVIRLTGDPRQPFWVLDEE
jgi:general secretion pathway protein K